MARASSTIAATSSSRTKGLAVFALALMVIGPAGPVVDAVVVSPAEPVPSPEQPVPAEQGGSASDAELEGGTVAAVAAAVASPVVALASPVMRYLTRGRTRAD